MDFSPLEHSDLDSLKEFQPEAWTDIVPHNRYFIDSPFCYPLKLTINNKLVGIGTYIMHADTVWLAHIIIHKEYRGHGFGTLITEKLVNSIDHKKFKTIYLIATELGEHVYKKLDFITETEYLFFKDSQLDKNIPISPNIIPFEEKYRIQVIDLDKEVSGEDRENRLKETINSSLLFIKNNELLGCYFPNLGEGMIIARTPEAGIELMKLRLQSKEQTIMPVENNTAMQFLLSNNYKEVRRAKRMLLGERRPWKPTLLFNRVNGQLG